MQTYKCMQCGHDVSIGEFPFCRGNPSDHGPWLAQEAPMEELVEEHLTDMPGGAHFTTRSELHKFLDKEHLQPHKPRDSFQRKTARGATGKLLVFDMGHR